jgi:antitoxin HicB
MKKMMKIPLVLQPQKEGGWTITSPLVPELVTEIDELEHLHACVYDALGAVMELYQDMGKEFPPMRLALSWNYTRIWAKNFQPI